MKKKIAITLLLVMSLMLTAGCSYAVYADDAYVSADVQPVMPYYGDSYDDYEDYYDSDYYYPEDYDEYYGYDDDIFEDSYYGEKHLAGYLRLCAYNPYGLYFASGNDYYQPYSVCKKQFQTPRKLVYHDRCWSYDSRPCDAVHAHPQCKILIMKKRKAEGFPLFYFRRAFM